MIIKPLDLKNSLDIIENIPIKNKSHRKIYRHGFEQALVLVRASIYSKFKGNK